MILAMSSFPPPSTSALARSARAVTGTVIILLHTLQLHRVATRRDRQALFPFNTHTLTTVAHTHACLPGITGRPGPPRERAFPLVWYPTDWRGCDGSRRAYRAVYRKACSAPLVSHEVQSHRHGHDTIALAQHEIRLQMRSARRRAQATAHVAARAHVVGMVMSTNAGYPRATRRRYCGRRSPSG